MLAAADIAMPPAKNAPHARLRFWRDPALPFLEGRHVTGSLSCYAPHTHPTLSIGIVDDGASTFSLADSAMRITPGDVVLVKAGDVHCCNPDDLQRWSYRMFHLDQAWLQALLAESPESAISLPGMRSQVIRSPHAVTLLDRLSTALERPCGDLTKEAAVIASLVELMQLCSHSNEAVHPDTTADLLASPGLQAAHAYLDAHCLDRVGLDTLSAIAGVGRYQLIRLFRRHYGMTPHALQLDMRINRARLLLQQGASAADAAYDTGFADQSHFHRAFKSRVAATPAQYQRI